MSESRPPTRRAQGTPSPPPPKKRGRRPKADLAVGQSEENLQRVRVLLEGCPQAKWDDMDGIVSPMVCPPGDDWTQADEDAITAEFEASSMKDEAKKSGTQGFSYLLTLWKTSIRVLKRSPLDLISVKHHLRYQALPPSETQSVGIYSRSFCESLTMLIAHPFWRANPMSFGLALEYAVLSRLKYDYYWPIREGTTNSPLDILRNDLRKMRPRKLLKPIHDMHVDARRLALKYNMGPCSLSDILYHIGQVASRSTSSHVPDPLTGTERTLPLTGDDLKNIIEALDRMEALKLRGCSVKEAYDCYEALKKGNDLPTRKQLPELFERACKQELRAYRAYRAYRANQPDHGNEDQRQQAAALANASIDEGDEGSNPESSQAADDTGFESDDNPGFMPDTYQDMEGGEDEGEDDEEEEEDDQGIEVQSSPSPSPSPPPTTTHNPTVVSRSPTPAPSRRLTRVGFPTLSMALPSGGPPSPTHGSSDFPASQQPAGVSVASAMESLRQELQDQKDKNLALEEKYSDLEERFSTMEESFSLMGENFLTMGKTFSKMRDLTNRVADLEEENRLLRVNQRENPLSDIVSPQQRHDTRDNSDLGDDNVNQFPEVTHYPEPIEEQNAQQEVQPENAYVPGPEIELANEEEDMVDYGTGSDRSSEDGEMPRPTAGLANGEEDAVDDGSNSHHSPTQPETEAIQQSEAESHGQSSHITEILGGETESSGNQKTLHGTGLSKDFLLRHSNVKPFRRSFITGIGSMQPRSDARTFNTALDTSQVESLKELMG
ncbi:hypothetical protein ACHAPJ_012950 [Fusarium lateritium]